MTVFRRVVRTIETHTVMAVFLFAWLITCFFSACSTTREDQRTFATPEEAVKVLTEATKAGNMDELMAIFGPDAEDIVASSDPVTSKQNREVFVVAVAEQWRLNDIGDNRKELEIGYENWPFPVPLVKDANGWRFDTAAGKEEILTRRIGRNELAVVGICETYVRAQEEYASIGRDGKPAGNFAQKFASDAGKYNGLYWPVKRGERLSPLGEMVAQASAAGPRKTGEGKVTPFHGYYFRILTAQGKAAAGGAKNYVMNGEMSGGFAMIAWPAEYDVTGIMTFVVNHDGIVYEKDLGPETADAVKTVVEFDPDESWTIVE